MSAVYGDNIKAFNTTLMPDIPGLLSIVTMIFAPKIELRVKRNVNLPGSVYYYSGLLAGLGLLDGEKSKKSDGVNAQVQKSFNLDSGIKSYSVKRELVTMPKSYTALTD